MTAVNTIYNRMLYILPPLSLSRGQTAATYTHIHTHIHTHQADIAHTIVMNGTFVCVKAGHVDTQ